MSARAATFWTFVVTSVAVFMVSLDNLVVTTALPVIRQDLGATLAAAGVDGERVHAHLRRAPADRRRAGRPVRAQADVRPRPADLHRRLRSRGAGAEQRGAHRRPGPAGRRRRYRHAAHPDDPLRGRASGPPRHGARHLGRRQRPGRRARPGGRRRHRRGPLVAVDLLDQRPDRPRAAADRADPPDRVQGPQPLARPARPRAWPASACSASCGVWSAATSTAGPASAWPAPSPPASSSWARSSSGSVARRSRWCRCASSATARSRPPTSPRC